MNNQQFRKVNPSLDKTPNLGPFPADQVFPWALITGGSYYFFKVLLGLSWIWTGVIAGWGISTWWVLTAEDSWKFLAKFVAPPDWVRAQVKYERMRDEV